MAIGLESAGGVVARAPQAQSVGPETVLIVGGTGYVGGRVVREAVARGCMVRVLARRGADVGPLVDEGAEVVFGDLLERASLDRALAGCRAVVTTAIGYANRRRGDMQNDVRGNRNLIDAAVEAGVGRFVFCSVLNCHQSREVPHFWDKQLTEEYLAHSALPFVALRPGAFLDQGPNDFWAEGLRRGKLTYFADRDRPMSFVHTGDVARCLVQAIDLPLGGASLTADLGCDRAVSIEELAEIMGRILGRPVAAVVPPWPVVSSVLGLAGLVNPWMTNVRAMMRFFRQRAYVADLTNQHAHFGVAPTVEDSVRRYLEEAGLLA